MTTQYNTVPLETLQTGDVFSIQSPGAPYYIFVRQDGIVTTAIDIAGNSVVTLEPDTGVAPSLYAVKAPAVITIG